MMMLQYCKYMYAANQPLDTGRSACLILAVRKTRIGRLLDIHVAFLLRRDSFACTPYRTIETWQPMGGHVCVRAL